HRKRLEIARVRQPVLGPKRSDPCQHTPRGQRALRAADRAGDDARYLSIARPNDLRNREAEEAAVHRSGRSGPESEAEPTEVIGSGVMLGIMLGGGLSDGPLALCGWRVGGSLAGR